MDTNQDRTETPEDKQADKPADAGWQHTESEPEKSKKPELKLPMNLSMKMPSFKMPEGGLKAWIKTKLGEYKRVYSITKKPDKSEFTATVKASGLGIIVIGMVGFVITMIVQLIQMSK